MRQAFHRDHMRDRATQKARSRGLTRGSSTPVGVGGELLAQDQLDDRLLALAAEEGGEDSKDEQRVGEQDSGHAGILRKITAECEADSGSEPGISSIVDRAVAERSKFSHFGADGY